MNFPLLKREMGFAGTMLARRPHQLLLQVTNRCNMRCTFCTFPLNAVAPSQELTIADFERLADELSELGHFLISIEGGEPFARLDLLEIVRILSRDHLTVLYTNGWYVTPENAPPLFDAGLAQVGVSIDFPDRRHDTKRGLPGALDRAVRALGLFRDAAPHSGKQVHVITVLMQENFSDMETLLQLSAAHQVGHVVTLLSDHGPGRAKGYDAMPASPVSKTLLELWKRHPHWRFWSEYLDKMDDFLTGGPMPACRAGLQSFNIDHVGNVAVCIEKIDHPVGNIREEPLRSIHDRLVASRAQVESCQECWTACRAFGQITGAGGSLKNWLQMGRRMRSY